jgi:CHASE2 domain-containing sensor protein
MGLSPAELSNKFKGTFVLLGDAKYEADKASVPGRQEPVPGVFVHASAAYTLASAPLWELKEWFSLTTTALISAFVLVIIYQINSKFDRHFPIPPVALGVLHTLLWIVVFCLVAWWLATNKQIVWLEVIAVCLVLILHCFLEVLVGTIKWKRLREELVDPFAQASQPGK